MSLVQFYGVLATTASIFVGILTAYLVNRLSDLKSERSRLKQRIEAIDAELRVLQLRHDFRIGRLEETEERWKRQDAEDAVDNFIEYTVGRDWNPSPDKVSIGDALDALVDHQNIAEDELIQHHMDVIEERWDEIIENLEPRPPGTLFPSAIGATSSSDPLRGANWIIEALWKIYDHEKYDTHDLQVLNIRQSVEELQDRRTVLVEQYNSLDPEQLRDSITASIVPIVLSVVLPIFIRLLHELGWVLKAPPYFVPLEPIGVLLAWLVGFFWTLRFVWVRITETDEDIPKSPLSDEQLSGQPASDDTTGATTAQTDDVSEGTEVM